MAAIKKKILFIKMGSFSLINNSILKILQNEFNNYSVDVIDVKIILKNHLKVNHFFINIFHFIHEYGTDFIKGNKKLNELYSWYFGTSYFSKKISEFMKLNVDGENYKFTFQTQCLFNAKIDGVPNFIYTDHTTQTNLLYPHINPRRYIRSDEFIKTVEAHIYNNATMIFTCGSLITYSLINQYHIKKSKVLTVFAGSNADNMFIENDKKYNNKNILFVGVDWKRKGGPTLLKVFEKVLQFHKDASLTIIGCSPNTSLPNCTIVGKISADKLSAYYNNATVFCLPTLREPFGIVFVEAMHYKLPVVANNIGSIPDMVFNGINGYLVNNIIDDYVSKICFLFDHPEKCKEFGENGYKLAQAKFTWSIVGKKIKEHISQNL